MNFERLNGSVKVPAHIIKNFKNPLYTLAYRRQCASLALILQRKSNRDFISLPQRIFDIPTDNISTADNFSEYDFPMDIITIGENVVVNGTNYKKNTALLMGWEDFGFVFGLISFVIFESKGKPIFLVKLFDAVEFYSPLHSYCVKPRNPLSTGLCTTENLCDHRPLDMYLRNGKYFIRLQYHVFGGVKL